MCILSGHLYSLYREYLSDSRYLRVVLRNEKTLSEIRARLNAKEARGFPCEAGFMIMEVTQLVYEAVQFSFEGDQLFFERCQFSNNVVKYPDFQKNNLFDGLLIGYG